MTIIHLQQLGLTSVVETPKLRDGELDQPLGTLTKEASTRNQTRQERLEKLKTEQVEFPTKCRTLTKTVIPGPAETDTDKPLEKAYQLFESVVSNLQAQLQTKKEEKKEETSVLLRHQYMAFLEAHKVLQEHLQELDITEEVLCSRYTHYGQVFQQD